MAAALQYPIKEKQMRNSNSGKRGVAIGLAIFGLGGFTPIVDSLWQIATAIGLRLVTKSVFLKNGKKDED